MTSQHAILQTVEGKTGHSDARVTVNMEMLGQGGSVTSGPLHQFRADIVLSDGAGRLGLSKARCATFVQKTKERATSAGGISQTVQDRLRQDFQGAPCHAD